MDAVEHDGLAELQADCHGDKKPAHASSESVGDLAGLVQIVLRGVWSELGDLRLVVLPEGRHGLVAADEEVDYDDGAGGHVDDDGVGLLPRVLTVVEVPALRPAGADGLLSPLPVPPCWERKRRVSVEHVGVRVDARNDLAGWAEVEP